MKKYIIFFLLLLNCIVHGQNKMGYTWVVGFNASFAKFDGTNNFPQTGQLYNVSHPNTPFMYARAQSNICDSITGAIVLSTTGMILYNAQGDIIENGDNLQPTKAYNHNSPPILPLTQGSLILPKGTNGEYYVFIPTVSDSLYDLLWTNPNGTAAPFDMLRYNVVDMKLNSGSGKVVEKNKELLQNIELTKVMMQACKHSNGRDWWLLKHGSTQNTIYRFLVTKDSIYGPFIQTFAQPIWDYVDLFGQNTFSKDGKKYAAVMGNNSKLFMADFDRCTGELSNPKVFNMPIDSTTVPYWDNLGVLDSTGTGVCFSTNGNYLYIARSFNIYQFEYGQSDSSLAWYRVKHGFDTTQAAFEDYGQLYRAPNNRIYIGKYGGSLTQFSTINNPDNKGVACGFCRKCFRIDTAQGGLTSPPNMPDYDLGADMSSICWPLGNVDVQKEKEVAIYPNPANSFLIIESETLNQQTNEFSVFNLLGEEIWSRKFKTTNSRYQIDVSHFKKGIYLLKVNEYVRKLVIE